jgi:ABC-type arginine transport system permease subunit
VAGVATIGFIFGAYFTEVLRGAFLAVPEGQREAALAYGFSRWQVLWRIVGPQMLRHALPGLQQLAGDDQGHGHRQRSAWPT